MVKALHFKGDKKAKKRKRVADPNDADSPTSKALTTSAAAVADNDAAAAQDDDSWVNADAASDITGPIVIVLPTDPITFLACDANGKVFCSEVENSFEGKAETAEPHDVRQVWVANRVAGTDNLSLKGHHGRYLSISKQGIPSATTTAISPTESLLAVPIPPPSPPSTGTTLPTFALQTSHSTYLSTSTASTSTTPDLRGDATDLAPDTTLHIRMQARFKPRHAIAKAEKADQKITRKELEGIVGRKLEDEEVRVLKRAKREGDFYERCLDLKVKGSHDKYA